MIVRDSAAATGREFDLVIVGGGIYGASLLLEAARSGMRACLLEAGDFGGGASWNSLRIVHGGLRYLQSADLRRFLQSVAARKWFATTFPDLVRPLPCLMPLYGKGLRRSAVMRVALGVNDALSARRNRGVAAPLEIPSSRIITAQEARKVCQVVRSARLEGAAVWTDYAMISSERILIQMLKWASSLGAVALNYCKVESVRENRGRVSGVEAVDRLDGKTLEVRSRSVVNCAGPWLRSVANRYVTDADTLDALFHPSLAFNLLLDVELPGDHALAVASPRSDAPVLFLRPQQGSTLAGTIHLPRSQTTETAAVSEQEIAGFLTEINEAIPELGLKMNNVRRVFAGLLPAAWPGTAKLARREAWLDHGRVGGPRGLISVSGVKFTTAHSVARATIKILSKVNASNAKSGTLAKFPARSETPGVLVDAPTLRTANPAELESVLRRTVKQEAVQNLDDLVLRRTNWSTTEIDLTWCYRRVIELLGQSVPNHQLDTMQTPIESADSLRARRATTKA